MEKQKKYNLEERLIQFAVSILDLSESIPKTYAGNHLSKQIVRSGTAPALLYGEAQGAESPADFVHKMKVALKELRETYICLRILEQKEMLKAIDKVKQENNELISIFVASIATANRNRGKK
jgi:four helix bundle protein